MSSTQSPPNPLIHGPILSTLARLAMPNVLALTMAVAVAMAETFYVGRLGLVPLAAMALVFPLAMLTQMMSNGAMGSSVVSAISRALGAGQQERAGVLALHAVLIGATMGVVYSFVLVLMGATFYRWLGGDGAVLAEATRFGAVLFSGAVLVWLSNTLASVVRGTGNMRFPSAVTFVVCVVQIALGGWLSLGRQWGMLGVAVANIVAMTLAATAYLWYLECRQTKLRIVWRWSALSGAIFRDILRVGAVACVSPLQTVLAAMIVTAMVARFGPHALAGYGIGQRMEFLVMPLAFGIGMAVVPMVGMAIGAGNVARARQVLWTGGVVAAVVVGALGVAAAVWPSLWSGLFTQDAQVQAYANQYLQLAGPGFGFLGMGLVMYFASLGAGHVVKPVLVGTLRLLFVCLVGLGLMSSSWVRPEMLFALVGTGMALYGLGTWWTIKRAQWGAA